MYTLQPACLCIYMTSMCTCDKNSPEGQPTPKLAFIFYISSKCICCGICCLLFIWMVFCAICKNISLIWRQPTLFIVRGTGHGIGCVHLIEKCENIFKSSNQCTGTVLTILGSVLQFCSCPDQTPLLCVDASTCMCICLLSDDQVNAMVVRRRPVSWSVVIHCIWICSVKLVILIIFCCSCSKSNSFIMCYQITSHHITCYYCQELNVTYPGMYMYNSWKNVCFIVMFKNRDYANASTRQGFKKWEKIEICKWTHCCLLTINQLLHYTTHNDS